MGRRGRGPSRGRRGPEGSAVPFGDGHGERAGMLPFPSPPGGVLLSLHSVPAAAGNLCVKQWLPGVGASRPAVPAAPSIPQTGRVGPVAPLLQHPGRMHPFYSSPGAVLGQPASSSGAADPSQPALFDALSTREFCLLTRFLSFAFRRCSAGSREDQQRVGSQQVSSLPEVPERERCCPGVGR